MERYKTVWKEAHVEEVIERSRFIAHIRPVETKEEADDFFAEIRAEYRDATHNVPSFVIGEQFNLQWASDDGEPQGTSGAPMAQMLVREGVTNTALIVTRYFGGIKLGTGGLVRAYTGVGKLALEAAGICSVEERNVLQYRIDYSAYEKVRKLAEEGRFQLQNPLFEAEVSLELVCPPEEAEALRGTIRNMTAGKARETGQSSALVKVRLT